MSSAAWAAAQPQCFVDLGLCPLGTRLLPRRVGIRRSGFRPPNRLLLRQVQELAQERPSLRCVDAIVRVVRVALAVAAARHRDDAKRALVELRRAGVAEAESGAGADTVPLLVVE